MDLEELKKLREQNFIAHKKKKKQYYLKNKVSKKTVRKEIDYSEELNNENFANKIKEIAKAQKAHIDDRKELIVAKINEYKNKKKEYYSENKKKRLEYDKEYREKKKEELKEYRKEYYRKNKEKILAKQKEKRKS
ncbi:MAG: hypothetical protein ACPG9K_02730 [Poseidonibacter sp.]